MAEDEVSFGTWCQFTRDTMFAVCSRLPCVELLGVSRHSAHQKCLHLPQALIRVCLRYKADSGDGTPARGRTSQQLHVMKELLHCYTQLELHSRTGQG